MKIGLIDNDLVSRDNHNFPNLAIMKLSSWHKINGDDVNLIGFNEINPNSLFPVKYDKIYISKAFTDSITPDFIYKMDNIKIGGTGFYFDKAQALPNEIEHCKPDYEIYNKALKFVNNNNFYTDYSIGFTTRGCFRKCPFCVNKNSCKVQLHSPIKTFIDYDKPKICLLDDNVLGLSNKELFKLFDEFEEINKPIQYRQGLDIRLLTEERIKRLFKLRYDGGRGTGTTYYFAFDLMKYKEEIENKLKLWNECYLKYKAKSDNIKWNKAKLFVFCGFNEFSDNSYQFWINDIKSIFERYKIIFHYKAQPYLMKHEHYKKSPFPFLYDAIANYTNDVNNCIASLSFNEYIDTSYKNMKLIKDFRDKNKELIKYFDVKLSVI